MALEFTVRDDQQYTDQARLDEIFANPGFGDHFTDHMAVATWTKEKDWHDAGVVRYGSLASDPASAVFHYAQEIFEGLKAYRRADGSVWLFRPEANGERLRNSAARLALPQLPVEDFVAGVRALVEVDQRWVPGGAEQSLYLRPFTIANENFLGVRAAHTATFCVIASPVGAYFKGGVSAVDIWVSLDSSRAGAGGTGAAKCGGNYAASLQATNEAYAHGCSQVLFLDATDRSHIDELGGMNFFVITRDGQLVTPELTGNILPGITRDSILTMAPDIGFTPVERRITLQEVLDGIADGSIVEAFACGTAAVVTPIASLTVRDQVHRLPEVAESQSLDIRQRLVDIQYGRAEDPYGWTHKVC
ncbi:branched chain amino acid aminotransferase [Luteococcus japonicus]|uniref:Branched-chain-amino-acid aminotransferase n=2 Tax=Luteococcus japonicus TaxID=33984 RepID=A0A1R4JRZ7_9ACTN|nr:MULTISPECIES: branched-chain amino acid aminotransferase [Luteococcus]MDN5562353.1 branched-chain amino acid aminotransferase [Luteococcus sp.]ROR55899.1 branched chain amino acid aminotransferase [Luteococcus japonicus]SJN34768.1 Branched-chain amino acid aminotransferase [Luteococcus japonicus LSP_Lj1]